MHSSSENGPYEAHGPLVTGASDNGQTLYVQGLLALRNDQPEDAIVLLDQALRLQPDHPGMRRNLVRALLVARRFQEVVVQADAALQASPNDAELHFARGTALNTLGRNSEAYAAFSKALEQQPNHAAAWLNMGNAAADLDDPSAAERMYRTAIGLDPALIEAHASLGYILTMQARLAEAIEACEAAIRLQPDFAQAHWNLAVAALLGGDLARGFQEYEWRKHHQHYHADFPALAGRQWDGKTATGLTVLVRAEQGFGDVIQFARYLALIDADGGIPVLSCADPLLPLLQTMPGVEVVSSVGPVPPHDAWIDQASLPFVYHTTLETIPAAQGYLRAEPSRVRAWQDRLPAGWKVGVAFSGNPKHPADRRRSVPMALAKPLLDMGNVSFVNLQHGPSAADLPLPDLTAWMTDYAETAALIESLDLVIAVDTSVAHLAGALGKPVWILLPHAPDWRWLLNRTDSPWYGSARLFRQSTAGDWAGVMVEVMRALRKARDDASGSAGQR